MGEFEADLAQPNGSNSDSPLVADQSLSWFAGPGIDRGRRQGAGDVPLPTPILWRTSMHNGVKYLAAVAGALALAACSDSSTSPVARTVAPSAASLSVTPGTNSFTIASDAGSQYCPTAAQLGVFTPFPATYAPISSGCIAAQDIETDGSLGAYNPGWDQLTGGHWIGFTVN